MKKYVIEQVSVGETRTGERNGKPWKGTKVGLKIAGQWYNSMVFNQDWVAEVRNLPAGNSLELILYKDKYISKKTGETVEYDTFRVPGKLELLENRVKKLEDTVYGNQVKEEVNKNLPPDEPDDDLPF